MKQLVIIYVAIYVALLVVILFAGIAFGMMSTPDLGITQEDIQHEIVKLGRQLKNEGFKR